ncbi:MAG: hypothetical protein K5879_07615 [Lachnospiraceae bacterium]|nr:hypothetical protein [Lachnospiraceae bacterium]
MKRTTRIIIECTVVSLAILLIIHRRVISAALTGAPMPEAPAWHKKFLPCCKALKKDEDEE